MNYEKLYHQIIENRKANPFEGYTENHHILPKSLGGKNGDNLVRLSAREHYLCHWLLIKMYPENTKEWYKMVRAFNNMNRKSSTGQIYGRKINSILYQKGREMLSVAMSAAQKGKGNSQYGKKYVYHAESCQCRATRDWLSYLKRGWKFGRKLFRQESRVVMISPTGHKKLIPVVEKSSYFNNGWTFTPANRVKYTTRVKNTLEVIRVLNEVLDVYLKKGYVICKNGPDKPIKVPKPTKNRFQHVDRIQFMRDIEICTSWGQVASKYGISGHLAIMWYKKISGLKSVVGVYPSKFNSCNKRS